MLRPLGKNSNLNWFQCSDQSLFRLIEFLAAHDNNRLLKAGLESAKVLWDVWWYELVWKRDGNLIQREPWSGD